MRDRLYRSRDDAVIGGVAGGVAEALNIDPSIVRVVWVLLAFMTGGLAALVYLIMLIVVPEEPEGPEDSVFGGSAPTEPYRAAGAGSAPTEPAYPADPGLPPAASPVAATAAATARETTPTRRRRGNRNGGGALVFGVILILVGAYFLVRQYIPALDLDLVWPVVVIVVGAVLVLGALRANDRSRG